MAANDWAVDAKGTITLNGAPFRIKGGSWFGLEGRSELPNDEKNPSGAPMELYMGNVFWSKSTRTLASDAESRHQRRYGYLTNKNSDERWQKAFVDYLIKEGVYNSFYWSINPESADTYGIFKSPYDPISNKSGWGTWLEVDTRKTSLLEKLWNATETDKPGTSVISAEHVFCEKHN